MTDLFCQLKRLRTDFDAFASHLARLYDVEHLSGPQGLTVIYLYRHQEQEVFIKDIMVHVKISKSVASSLMKRMEKNQFIQLLPSSRDKRYKQVVLTNLGIAKAEKLEAFFKALETGMLRGISAQDLATALAVMEQLQANLKEGVVDVQTI